MGKRNRAIEEERKGKQKLPNRTKIEKKKMHKDIQSAKIIKE